MSSFVIQLIVPSGLWYYKFKIDKNTKNREKLTN